MMRIEFEGISTKRAVALMIASAAIAFTAAAWWHLSHPLGVWAVGEYDRSVAVYSSDCPWTTPSVASSRCRVIGTTENVGAKLTRHFMGTVVMLVAGILALAAGGAVWRVANQVEKRLVETEPLYSEDPPPVGSTRGTDHASGEGEAEAYPVDRA